MTPIQIRAMQWCDSAPESAGLWLMRCYELDNRPEEVRIFQRDDSVLMADDPHLGVTVLQILHDGLTSRQWAKKYPR